MTGRALPPRRVTARVRITLVCCALVATSTVVILIVVWMLMRFVPTYAITSSPLMDGGAPDGTSFSAPVSSARATAPPEPGTDGGVVIGAVIRSESDVLTTLLRTSAAAVLPVTALGALVSWIVAGRLLRPVHSLTLAARRAADGALDHRIRLTGPKDEFGQLADTFNEMLDRLQVSFEAHRRFAANASHELRTPLATTKAVLDSALRHPDRVDTTNALRRLRVTNDEAHEIVRALLDLAEVTGGDLHHGTVSLSSIVEHAVDGVRADAEGAGVTVRTAITPAVVSGDRALLARLVANLVQNAVRHNVPGGRIDIVVEPSPPLLRVGNSGDHSADDVVDQLVEPLYRARGRVRHDGRPRGHGLGLTLAMSVAAAHGADIELEPSTDGGLETTVTFPDDVTEASGGTDPENDDGALTRVAPSGRTTST
jgi:two-component system sensor histidine kinase VanS